MVVVVKYLVCIYDNPQMTFKAGGKRRMERERERREAKYSKPVPMPNILLSHIQFCPLLVILINIHTLSSFDE
jgi:hypothetical protein